MQMSDFNKASSDSGSFDGFKELEDTFKAHFELAEQQLEEALAETSVQEEEVHAEVLTKPQEKIEWNWPNSRSGQDKFIKKLRLSADQLISYRAIIAKVTDVCLQTADVDAGQIVTCGSMGKGTASPYSADVDLVVFIDWIDALDIPEELPSLLNTIQDTVERQYPSSKDTRSRGKFSLSYVIDDIEISIWIGVSGIHPKDFLDTSSAEKREYLRASVLPAASKFMKRQHDLFHNMVRVVRQWRDSLSWEPKCKPSSYLLEVLILEAFRMHRLCNINTGKTSKHSYPRFAHKLLVTFFQLVASVDINNDAGKQYSADDLPPVFIYFGAHYSKEEIPVQSPEPLFQIQREYPDGTRKTHYATALVVDPVNPTVNLWLDLIDPTSFVSRAKLEEAALSKTATNPASRNSNTAS